MDSVPQDCTPKNGQNEKLHVVHFTTRTKTSFRALASSLSPQQASGSRGQKRGPRESLAQTSGTRSEPRKTPVKSLTLPDLVTTGKDTIQGEDSQMCKQRTGRQPSTPPALPSSSRVPLMLTPTYRPRRNENTFQRNCTQCPQHCS